MAQQSLLADIQLQQGKCFLVTGQLDFTSVPVLMLSAAKLLAERQSTHDSDGIEVDLSSVSDSNSAGIAFLLELNRLSRSLNKSFRIINMPSQMQVIARVHGVDELLQELSPAT